MEELEREFTARGVEMHSFKTLNLIDRQSANEGYQANIYHQPVYSCQLLAPSRSDTVVVGEGSLSVGFATAPRLQPPDSCFCSVI